MVDSKKLQSGNNIETPTVLRQQGRGIFIPKIFAVPPPQEWTKIINRSPNLILGESIKPLTLNGEVFSKVQSENEYTNSKIEEIVQSEKIKISAIEIPFLKIYRLKKIGLRRENLSICQCEEGNGRKIYNLILHTTFNDFLLERDRNHILPWNDGNYIFRSIENPNSRTFWSMVTPCNNTELCTETVVA